MILYLVGIGYVFRAMNLPPTPRWLSGTAAGSPPGRHAATPRQRCVTDGGTPIDTDRLRTAAAPAVFAVDETGTITGCSDALARQTATDSPVDSPLSSLITVADGDLSDHLQAIRETLDASDRPTVESKGLLRTADGRQGVTVEFTTADEPDSCEAWLVGIVRPSSTTAESQPQPTGSPGRFRQLFEQLQDPVVEVRFVDTEPIVTSVNTAFEEMFGYTADELVGERLNEYIVPATGDSDPEPLDREAANGEWTAAEVVREAADGPRLFLFRGIPFSHDGTQCGFGVYTDITDRESQQRYHEVLNRLLRHNLRNDLNVILGLADQLTRSLETGETSSAAVGKRLKQRALELIETTRRARELESVIDRSETETAPIAVDELIEDACETLRESTSHGRLVARINSPAVGMGGPALREAVVELVENAVEHTTAEPTVEVRVERHTDRNHITITVADDGPGIPDDERAVIDGSRSISPLDHASGLGLWLAKWIVEAYGGELAFVGPDDRLGGAAIELRIREAPQQSTAASSGVPTERET